MRGAGRGHSFGICTGDKQDPHSRQGLETTSLHQCCLAEEGPRRRDKERPLEPRGEDPQDDGHLEESVLKRDGGPRKGIKHEGLTEWKGPGCSCVCRTLGEPWVCWIPKCGAPAVARPLPTQAGNAEM